MMHDIALWMVHHPVVPAMIGLTFGRWVMSLDEARRWL